MQSQNQLSVPSVVSPPVDRDKWLATLTEIMQETEKNMTLPLDDDAKVYMENLKKQLDIALRVVKSSQPITLVLFNKLELLIERAQQPAVRDYIQKVKEYYAKNYFLEPIPDPLLKIPFIPNMEKEKDDLLMDCISLSTMFDPAATIDGYVYEKESIVDFFNMNIEAKEIRSPKTNVPLPMRGFIPQPVVAMLIKRKMEENPFLLHDQALPVKTMKEAIKANHLAELGRLLDKDIIGRFLANDEVIHCVNEASSIAIFTLFKNKMKNNAKAQEKIFETLLTIVMEKGNIPLLVELLKLNPHYDPDIISRVQKKIKNQNSNLETMANVLSSYQQVSNPEDKPSFSLSYSHSTDNLTESLSSWPYNENKFSSSSSSSSSFVSSQISDDLVRGLPARPDNENKSSFSSSSSVSSQIPTDTMRSLYKSSSSGSHLATNSFSDGQPLERKKRGGSLERPVAQFQRQNPLSFLQFSSSASALSAPASPANQSDFRIDGRQQSVTDKSPRSNSNF